MNEVKVLDLFSGIGGFSLGLEAAGSFQTVAFCEQDKFCQAVLRKHWPDVPIYDDVRTIPTDRLGGIDLICGGFPCQPWSVAGEQRGAEDDRDLWPVMASLIEKVRPQWVIGENVRGFVNEPLGLKRSLSDLESIGYQAISFVIPACAVDAQHRRDRVWIIAHADSDSEPDGTVNEKQRRGELVGNTKRSRFSGVNRRGSGKEPENRCEDVADASSARLEGGKRKKHQGTRDGFAAVGQDVADANSVGPQTSGAKQRATGLVGESKDNGPKPWAVEPDVGRVAHGVRNRTHRLRALGNAVVPQVVTQIGKAIIEAER